MGGGWPSMKGSCIVPRGVRAAPRGDGAADEILAGKSEVRSSTPTLFSYVLCLQVLCLSLFQPLSLSAFQLFSFSAFQFIGSGSAVVDDGRVRLFGNGEDRLAVPRERHRFRLRQLVRCERFRFLHCVPSRRTFSTPPQSTWCDTLVLP